MLYSIELRGQLNVGRKNNGKMATSKKEKKRQKVIAWASFCSSVPPFFSFFLLISWLIVLGAWHNKFAPEELGVGAIETKTNDYFPLSDGSRLSRILNVKCHFEILMFPFFISTFNFEGISLQPPLHKALLA